VYTIYSTIGGGLIPGTAVAAGDGPRSVTIHPSGRFAYVANYNSNDILVYAISQTTGALTLRTTVSAGTCPISVTTCGVMQQGDAEVS
jgi:6-phosphogluconolactonase (cycloisomerase 2 family)